jgi:transcriptional antiterminator RfaH
MSVGQWYAARTKPRQESVAVENLERQGFSVYSPQVAIERLKAQRITTIREPLFPGYVLVRFVLGDSSWRTINSTRGVISLLTFGENGIPTAMPPGEVESIQRREKVGDLFISEIHKVQRGDSVRLKYGPAADAIGTVIFTRGERVGLLLHLLGRQTRVKAPLHAVEVVTSTTKMRGPRLVR